MGGLFGWGCQQTYSSGFSYDSEWYIMRRADSYTRTRRQKYYLRTASNYVSPTGINGDLALHCFGLSSAKSFFLNLHRKKEDGTRWICGGHWWRALVWFEISNEMERMILVVLRGVQYRTQSLAYNKLMHAFRLDQPRITNEMINDSKARLISFFKWRIWLISYDTTTWRLIHFYKIWWSNRISRVFIQYFGWYSE